MDHYQELLLAHAEGDPHYMRGIELQVINEAQQKMDGIVQVETLPIHIQAVEHWVALGLPEGNRIRWEGCNLCPVCDGDGTLDVWGKDGSDHEVDCPKCNGMGMKEGSDAFYIITDYDGRFIEERSA